MPYKAANFAEIETKLRQDFARKLRDKGHPSADINDPVLGVLFRTFASQLEALYTATEGIREGLLDELISGLGIERRMARPAQTVIRFFSESEQIVGTGMELRGIAPSGDYLTFTTDTTVAVSSARVAFAAAYQNESLQLLAGLELPEDMQASFPSRDAVPAKLGPNPAIYIAIENLPAAHLSQHGLFFDVSAVDVQEALFREIWRLADPSGRFGAKGILRPHRRNAGVLRLEWTQPPGGTYITKEGEADRPELPNGFYAGKVFVLPVVPPERSFLCRFPAGMESALSKLFRDAGKLFGRERAWLRISFAPNISDLHTGVHSVLLHTVSASNVVDLNQTIDFELQGTSLPVNRPDRYLVQPLTITGALDNTIYVAAFESAPAERVGRFTVRNGRVDLQPVKPGARPQGGTNVPVWVTHGALGNTVEPGQVQALVKSDGENQLRISNPMPAAGGTNGEAFGEAYRRFAEVLLSRSRVVTAADLDAVVKAFDRRILGSDVTMGVQRTEAGLQRVQQVVLSVDRNSFDDPDEEIRILREDVENYLRQRLLHGTILSVECRWAEGGPTAPEVRK